MQYDTRIQIKKINQGHEVFCSITQKNHSRFSEAQRITNVDFRLNGQIFAEISVGEKLSKNPIIGVELILGKPGDVVSVHWSDDNMNRGDAHSRITP
ncbi:MAG: hypothetical protein GKR96_04975 [Gammaproteobacteria bacterium]|nr:hypothetical protein [Gammaproteobacteria bacterium]